MADDDLYTNDGTLDIHKKPANKKKTGNWKACRFILGMILLVMNLIFDFDLFMVFYGALMLITK